MKKILLTVVALLAFSSQAFAATTYTSSQAASTVNPRTCDGNVCAVAAVYEISAAIVVNDVFQMVRVPAGATILEIVLQTDDVDSAGPSVVFDVGDGSSTDRFVDGCLTGQVAANDVACRINQVDGHNYVYSAEDTIDIIAQAAPATSETTGTLRLTVFYTMQGLQS